MPVKKRKDIKKKNQQKNKKKSYPPGSEKGIRLKSGSMKTVLFDRMSNIRRRYEWNGNIEYEPEKNDNFVNPLDDPIELNPYGSQPPKPDDDIDLLGDGPIELTPKGPIQPGKDDRLPPIPDDEKKEEDKPIKLDFWTHLPPPFPPPFWQPDIDLTPKPPIELGDFFSTYNPCDVFHPLGPLGPFIEPPDQIELIFPRAPWLGPYQPPLERALMEALKEFLDDIGKAGNQGTIHSKDWEKAGQKAGQEAAKALWEFVKDRLEKIYFGGDLNFDSFCEFAEKRPWTTGIGIFLGIAGFGLYLGDQYRTKGKIKIDFGEFKFEWDSETGEWSAGIRFKFKF